MISHKRYVMNIQAKYIQIYTDLRYFYQPVEIYILSSVFTNEIKYINI